MSLTGHADVPAFNSLSQEEQQALGGDPYYLAFQRVLAELLNHYEKPGEPVNISLVFDEDQHYSIRCYEMLARLRAKYSDYRRALVSISFADDEFFTMLQAADMFAYLVRREAEMRFCAGSPSQFSGLYAHVTDANVRGNLAVLGGLYGPEQLRALAKRNTRPKR